METKANPNPSGCLSRALPDEPMFILLGRDRCAPDAIRFWADQRSQLGVEQGESQDAEQVAEAIETADEFAAWRERNDGAWRNHHRDADVVPTPSDELSSIAGRIVGRGAAMGLARAATLTAEDLHRLVQMPEEEEAETQAEEGGRRCR